MIIEASGVACCPLAFHHYIKDSLQQATINSKSQVGAIFQVLHTKEMPPTYFQTNKFTESFQTIVDAYGFQFIPQMIFSNCLFGYLSLLIILKWVTGSQADLYHLGLLLLSLIAVPWMLPPKPFILKAQHNRTHQSQSYAPLEGTDESLQVEASHDPHGHEEFEFSEVFVHQLIHTIEFVLGAVSNTASYLR
nr:V-type proton ATPase subunit a2-like [Tanacetum cinerariifolium]